MEAHTGTMISPLKRCGKNVNRKQFYRKINLRIYGLSKLFYLTTHLLRMKSEFTRQLHKNSLQERIFCFQRYLWLGDHFFTVSIREHQRPPKAHSSYFQVVTVWPTVVLPTAPICKKLGFGFFCINLFLKRQHQASEEAIHSATASVSMFWEVLWLEIFPSGTLSCKLGVMP